MTGSSEAKVNKEKLLLTARRAKCQENLKATEHTNTRLTSRTNEKLRGTKEESDSITIKRLNVNYKTQNNQT